MNRQDGEGAKDAKRRSWDCQNMSPWAERRVLLHRAETLRSAQGDILMVRFAFISSACLASWRFGSRPQGASDG